MCLCASRDGVTCRFQFDSPQLSSIYSRSRRQSKIFSNYLTFGLSKSYLLGEDTHTNQTVSHAYGGKVLPLLYYLYQQQNTNAAALKKKL